MKHRCNAAPYIIAIKTDIKRANLRPLSFNFLDFISKSHCNGFTAADDAHQRNVFGAFVMLNDFMSNTSNGTREGRIVHDDSLGYGLLHIPSSKKDA